MEGQRDRDADRFQATVAGRGNLGARILPPPHAAPRVSLSPLRDPARTSVQAQARVRPAPRRPGRVWARSAGSSSRISTAVSTCGRRGVGAVAGGRRLGAPWCGLAKH